MTDLIILNFFADLFQSFAVGIFILMILPVFIQVALNTLITMFNSMMRMNIRPFLNMILFPGAILRITVIFLVLWMRGWKLRIFYGINVGVQAPTSTSGGFGRGFSVSMKPPYHRSVSFWDSLIFMGTGYAIWILALLIIAARPFIVELLQYNFGIEMGKMLSNYIIISMVIGGMPVPEETLTPLYWLAANKPHMILATILAVISSAFAGGSWGAPWGQIFFLSIMGYNLIIDQLHSRRFEKILTGNGRSIDLSQLKDVVLI